MKAICMIGLVFVLSGIAAACNDASSDVALIQVYFCNNDETTGVQSCPEGHPIYGGGKVFNQQHSWFVITNNSPTYTISTINGDEIRLYLYDVNGQGPIVREENNPSNEYHQNYLGSDSPGVYIDILRYYGMPVQRQPNEFELKPNHSLIGFVEYFLGDDEDDILPTHGRLWIKTGQSDVPVLINLGWESFAVRRQTVKHGMIEEDHFFPESSGGSIIDKEILRTEYKK